MNQELRNKLRSVVTQCRKLLEEAISQELEGKYGIFARKDQVTADPHAPMTHLTEEEQAYRRDLIDHINHIQSSLSTKLPRTSNKEQGTNSQEQIALPALDQLVREIAFTHLNRLCAYKMMEAREVYVGGQKFREAVSRGANSNGVKFYLAAHEDDERLFSIGRQDLAYRHFLDWLGETLSTEIGVLFSPNDPANRLYPRQKTLDDVLELLNSGGIKAEDTELREAWPEIWSQDETIGWVYQYFTPKELRDQARKESQAPRNSYELAFRNQFFTPRYVVEFLTDNTLGRIWYEMRKGDTKLKDQCRYMVRRPNEIFLDDDYSLLVLGSSLFVPGSSLLVPGASLFVPGSSLSPPTQAPEEPPQEPSTTNQEQITNNKEPITKNQEPITNNQDQLTQEELLNLPVQIPHRPKKDPRELKILDPACGSGHFLLYCFDLLLTIYEEAYADSDLGPTLRRDYPTLENLRRDLPRLILAHNLHGIDIDVRATQIAALALWLRCQRAYHEMGLKKDRPRITRSNFVCAEPMPGEAPMLKEFVAQLEPRVLGQFVEVVFDKMKLAGEAGSLLKIEEEIRDAVAAARAQWDRETVRAIDRRGQPMLFAQAELDELDGKPVQGSLFDLTDITDRQFFEQAESQVIEELRRYAENAQDGQRLQRRLFTEDAVRGFAFVELSQKRYDVVLMNPPFGEPVRSTSEYLQAQYPHSKHDLFAAFCDRCLEQLAPLGLLGELSSRVGFFLKSFADWRHTLIYDHSLKLMVDLGAAVLDTAAVEACCYIVAKEQTNRTLVFRLLLDSDKAGSLATAVADLTSKCLFAISSDHARDLPLQPLVYWVPRKTLQKFSKFNALEPKGAVVRQGLGTGDNTQFIRAFWEVPADRIAGFHCKTPQDVRNQLSGDYCQWAFHIRAGSSQPWYSPLTLVIEWSHQGERLKNHWRSKGESPSRYIPSEDLYFRPGLSWTRRHFRLVPYIVPAGCIPSASRYMAFPNEGYESDVIAVSASVLATAFMRFYGEKFEWPNHLVDTFKRMPFLPLKHGLSSHLEDHIEKEMSQRRSFYRNREPFLDFTLPSAVKSWLDGESTGWNWFTLIGDELEEQIAMSFGLDKDELAILACDMNEAIQIKLRTSTTQEDSSADTENESDGDSELNFDLSPRGLASDVISWIFGVLIGRWDVRYALDPSLSPSLPHAFSPSNPFPLGSLLGSDGRSARRDEDIRDLPFALAADKALHGKQVVSDDRRYPVEVSWDGVIPDDPEHASDLLAGIRRVLETIWPEEYERTEATFCEGLQIKNLGDYLRKAGNGGFWSDHIKRYSMSRRKAPIYWLLQSSKKSYALWLYYHRLDKDLLFKALVKYVEPKIRLEVTRLEALRNQQVAAGTSGKESKQLAKHAERQEDFLSELRDFEDKLRRAANLHLEPDLNDGVVLNIAPLHELVPWKEAKKHWDELIAGKYEWSSIGRQLREKGLVQC
ncbi:BREX-1 system adenine-specific DNA-methyltransferase PglX [uncultured Thiodictyon sp.]|jgi:hypothetical protein|uniref:BREX-1 system adenine-specific DNA-methyltransferase PglX n=1 Tax=uncultured Thiodictyon sp. TaxID=1846217 RepID=UPI0025D7E062|nr:BREX-1 system adenine-specific DNA-methyltransferase PglX [uncultured Thiodictyon sp.]